MSDPDLSELAGSAVSASGGRWRGVKPHDGLFRGVLSRPEHAGSLVAGIFPAELVARMDLGRLRVLDGSFVDERLRQQHTDALLSVPVDEQETLLYVLLDHQSSPDPLMAWRMVCYVVEVVRRYLAEHPGPPACRRFFRWWSTKASSRGRIRSMSAT